MSNGINLLDYKDKVERKKESRNIKILRISAIAFLFLVSALSITFFMLIALSPLPDLERRQNLASSTLSQSINDIIRLKLVKERAAGVTKIIENRKSYNIFIDYLREKVPSGVSVKSLSVSQGGINLILESSSLALLDEFFESLTENDESGITFSRADIPKVSTDQGGGLFVAELNIRL